MAVFRVTPEALRVARGRVQCGSCNTVFDALASLTDAPPDQGKDKNPDASRDDDATDAGQCDDSLARAVADLVQVSEAAPDDEEAWEALSDEPEAILWLSSGDDELDAIEAEGAAIGDHPDGPDADAEAEAEADSDDDAEKDPEPAPETEVDATDDSDELPAEWSHSVTEPDADPENDNWTIESPLYASPTYTVEPDDLARHGTTDDGAETDTTGGRTEDAAGLTPENDAVQASFDDPFAEPRFPPPRRERLPMNKRFAATGVVILIIALATQLLHYNRDELAATQAYGETVSKIYAYIGARLYPTWDISSYEVRAADAVAGQAGSGTLEIRAQVAVTGDRPTGIPMVRVVLRDRWSKPMGSRVFDASEFLTSDASHGRLLSPGTLLPVLITVVDPGMDAQGFEVDVCVPDRYQTVRCKLGGVAR
jgi:predicted Zn finger-like uncharacterized protein